MKEGEGDLGGGGEGRRRAEADDILLKFFSEVRERFQGSEEVFEVHGEKKRESGFM